MGCRRGGAHPSPAVGHEQRARVRGAGNRRGRGADAHLPRRALVVRRRRRLGPRRGDLRGAGRNSAGRRVHPPQWRRARRRCSRVRCRARDLMGSVELSSTQIVIGLAGALAVLCYVALILVPAIRCYGRVWEKLAAGVLTLYVLGTLLGIGAAIGLAIVWTYDTYA